MNLSTFGQMNFTSENFKVETVDEFGDKTGKMKVGIQANGYFSNSATTNSKATLILSFTPSAWATLYEYGSQKSHDKFKITFMSETQTITVKDYFDFDDKRLYETFTDFVLMCKDNDEIKVRMRENTDYGTPTTAVFKLFSCKEFYNMYISQFGDFEQITSERIGDHHLCIYTKPVIKGTSEANTVPGIKLRCKYMYEGKEYCDEVSIEGKFKNGDYLGYGTIIVDGKQMPKYYYREDFFNEFIKYVKPNSQITIKHEYSRSDDVSFIVTKEMYDAIHFFYGIED